VHDRQFLDATAAPSSDDIAALLGTAAPLWSELCAWLVEVGAHAEQRWGGDRSGWELVVRRAGRPFTTLSPRQDGFVALVVLGRREAEAARGVSLDPRTTGLLAETPQLHDGMWLYLPVVDRHALDSLVALLELKLPPTVRARLLRAA
jgi:hypothetical protein